MKRRKIKFGLVGLGRLGYEHTKNLSESIASAELVAICDMNEEALRTTAEEFDIPKTYTDFEEMCKDPEIEAVVIVSPSMFHVNQVKIAMDAGKHVFVEKPLDTSIEKCKECEEIVAAHPELTFSIGFMRRFDKSYKIAKQKIDNGDIGRIILVRSYCQDNKKFIDMAIKFGPHSGGQFLDMCIHDIDTIRWFAGGVEAREMWGIGGCYEYEEYKNWNDGDNVSALIQFEDDTMGFMFAGRAAAHGANIETEIIGTKGTLRIAAVGTDSLLEVLSENGVCRECYPDWQARWHDAYIDELADFADCIITGRKPEVTVQDGTKTLEIAYRCKESFESKKMLKMRD
ncbi:MAG: Gfo/Idh/MocA family oxidoreductase [Clostridiales Family XIII bacterium]|jgi:myo-inositol 2-dehydrogenase/D-chiro-inositol 1-dehydrogenase|nr:Gfo/Idh/MocA family oxidoreductase [Clostridiales Family XIII bacterium]